MAEVRRTDTCLIYCIVCPLIGRVRYVGKTVDPKRRFYEHRTDTDDNPHKRRWIAKLRALGMEPAFVVLEECPAALWRERERWWEHQFRAQGEPLTNIRECGNGPLPTGSPPKTPEGLERMREASLRRWGKGPWEGFVDPEGNAVPPIRSLSQFCKEQGLGRESMRHIYFGDARSYRGWTCARLEAQQRLKEHGTKPKIKTWVGLVAPDGTVMPPITNMSAFCREYDLNKCGMSAILRGENDSHKGWTCVHPDALAERARRFAESSANISRAQRQRARLGRQMYTVNGVTRSIPEWAIEIGMSRNALRARIKTGMPPEEWMRPPSEPDPATLRITIFGKTLGVEGWADELGILKGTIYARIARGWDPVNAVTASVDHRRGRKASSR